MNRPTLMELAPKQLDRVLAFFARVEAKASFVFAINSAMLGTLAVHVERSDLKSWPHMLSLIFAGIGLAVSFFYVYRCSYPNLKGGRSSLIYFREIAALREQQFVKNFRSISEDDFIDDTLSQVWRNSQILNQKFKALKVAFILTGASLIPWTAFLALAAIYHAPIVK